MWILFLWPNGLEKEIEKTLQRPTLAQFSIRQNNDEKTKILSILIHSFWWLFFLLRGSLFLFTKVALNNTQCPFLSLSICTNKQTKKYIYLFLLHKIKWEIKRKLSNTMLLFIKTLMERKKINIYKRKPNSHESLCVPGSFQLNNFSAHKTN